MVYIYCINTKFLSLFMIILCPSFLFSFFKQGPHGPAGPEGRQGEKGAKVAQPTNEDVLLTHDEKPKNKQN